jgi:hypothetical protein
VLLLRSKPPNIRRTDLPGKEVSAGLEAIWIETFYIVFLSTVFLLLTWYLGCRVNNTIIIWLKDITWANCFDCFHILIAHSKTDPTGDNCQYPRHIFANPTEPLVCPVLCLIMYFSTCFSGGVHFTENATICPGTLQEHCFSRFLNCILKEHEVEVKALGYDVSQIGSHSIQKCAASYITSMPGNFF